jgi:GntR family transcriptional regulator
MVTPSRVGRVDVHGDELPHAQVLRRIEADILAGRLAPGERLAPERELCERLGVARNTLRRALTELASRGLVEARGRQGWVIVAAAVTERVEGPQGLSEWAARQGFSVTSRLVTAHVRGASADEASRLRVVTGAGVFELERVRLIDGVPLSVDRSILHPRLVGDLAGVDLGMHSLYRILRERSGIVPSRADVILRAVRATSRAAKLLEIRGGDALLELDETVFDQYGEPFEAASLLNRGDRYAFATTLRMGSGSPRVELNA